MNNNFDLDTFNKDLKDKFGDGHDSCVAYEKRYMTMLCPIHGEYHMRKDKVLLGRICPLCREEKIINNFFSKAKEVHGDKYDYSKVNYVKSSEKVCIICPEHGEFWQTPNSHLSGVGCPKCGVKQRASNTCMTFKDFIKKANEKHGDKYDYSEVEYVNSKTKIKVICHEKDENGIEHGPFYVEPSLHLHRGDGCPKCAGRNKYKDKEYLLNSLNKVYKNDNYTFDKVIYRGYKEKITITCTEHGDFNITLNHAMRGQGCPKCRYVKSANSKRRSVKEVIDEAQKVHGDKYDYSLITEYKNDRIKYPIKCKTCGNIFYQPFNNHIQGGQGCPFCFTQSSKKETEVFDYVKSLVGEENIIKRDREILNGRELDIYIPSKKIAIEFNGVLWHNEKFNSDKNYHLKKTEDCLNKGVRLIHIFEDEWIYKQDIWKSMLANILGFTKNKIYARKCAIKEVNTTEGNDFLTNNHIQDICESEIKLGLYYNDELVSLMTFGKSRNSIGSNKHEWELLRFCNKLNTVVVGGASKLFKYFIKTYSANNIVSYADRRFSIGNLYDKLGFTLYNKSRPSYYYVIGNKRKNRINFQKAKLVEKYNCPTDMSEHEFCLSQKWYRIYDCGCLCYEWNSNQQN